MLYQISHRITRNLFKRLASNFCNVEQHRKKLNETIQQQLECQQQNFEKSNEQMQLLDKYFSTQGWVLSKNNTQVYLDKLQRPYTVKVVFNIRMNIEDSQQGELQNLTDALVCVKKDSNNKWLFAYYLIVNNKAYLSNINFSESYDKQVEDFKKNKTKSTKQYSELQTKAKELITLFLEELGVKNELLIQTSKYGLVHELDFYIEWLKDLKSLT